MDLGYTTGISELQPASGAKTAQQSQQDVMVCSLHSKMSMSRSTNLADFVTLFGHLLLLALPLCCWRV